MPFYYSKYRRRRRSSCSDCTQILSFPCPSLCMCVLRPPEELAPAKGVRQIPYSIQNQKNVKGHPPYSRQQKGKSSSCTHKRKKVYPSSHLFLPFFHSCFSQILSPHQALRGARRGGDGAQNDEIATAMTCASLWLILTVVLLTPALSAAALASPVSCKYQSVSFHPPSKTKKKPATINSPRPRERPTPNSGSRYPSTPPRRPCSPPSSS